MAPQRRWKGGHRGRRLAVALLVCGLGPGLDGAARAKGVIRPGREQEVLALLAPYGTAEDILPGWRCAGIAIEGGAIAITLRRGGERQVAMLRPPHEGGDTPYRTLHFDIVLPPEEGIPPTERARIGAALAALVAENDRLDLWSDPATALVPGREPGGAIDARMIVASLLLALGLVVALARLRSRLAAGPAPVAAGPPPVAAGPPPVAAGPAPVAAGPAPIDADPAGGAGPAPGAAVRRATISRREQAALAGLLAAALLAFLLPSWLRFARYGIKSFDFGIYSHGFWNAAHGHGFWNSAEGMDHLGSHASPILYLLLPAYALLPSPFTLLCLNGGALVAGAIPAYLIARRRFGAAASLLCAACYLAHPALASLDYDVHEATFAVPLLLFAFHFLDEGRALPFLGALAGALLCKENVGMVAIFLGGQLVLFRRERALGAAVILLGALCLVVGIGIVIPRFGGNHAHNTMFRYAHLGDGWSGLLLAPLRRPGALLGTLVSAESARYLALVLAPFACLPLLAPRELLPAMPILLQNLLASTGELRSGEMHYEALLLPAVYLAFVVGARRLADAWRAEGERAPQAMLAGVLSLALLLHLRFGRGFAADVEGDPARAEIDDLLAAVPPQAAAISPQHIEPHLADRTVSAYFRDPRDLADVDLPYRFAIVPIPSLAAIPPGWEPLRRGAAYALLERRPQAR